MKIRDDDDGGAAPYDVFEEISPQGRKVLKIIPKEEQIINPVLVNIEK